MEEEIKNLLNPHYGHLNFLLKIKRSEISIDDISNLLELINDKSLVSNLPKDLHSYNSYYVLMKDLFFVKKNIVLLKELKENLSSTPKRIVIALLSDDLIKRRLNEIIRDKELKSNFFRWSSRIKDIEFAEFYIKSFKSNSEIWASLDSEKSNLIELTDFKKHSKYIPSSWCIKKESTFYSHLENQKIFILKHKGKIYGVSSYKNGDITIQDSKNNRINQSVDHHLYNIAKSEIIKVKIFGTNSIKESDNTKTYANILFKRLLKKLKFNG